MNRIADRAYFGDTGGNVWRLDMGSSDVTEWTIERVAALGEHHKFLYPPDVVYGAHPARQYDAILIGSGDREKPHDAQSQNAYFMIQDYSWYNDPDAMAEAEADVITLDDLHDVTFFAADAESASVPADKHGWILRFEPGEKAVGGSVTLAGTVYFSTHQPGIASTSPFSCDMDLGIARNYAIGFVNATATAGLRYVVIPGGGFVPSPVAVLVPVEDPNNPGQTRLVEGVLRGTAFDESEGEQLLRRRRTFWFTEHDG
jgi:type IV pilus assembly protein PilY1